MKEMTQNPPRCEIGTFSPHPQRVEGKNNSDRVEIRFEKLESFPPARLSRFLNTSQSGLNTERKKGTTG